MIGLVIAALIGAVVLAVFFRGVWEFETAAGRRHAEGRADRMTADLLLEPATWRERRRLRRAERWWVNAYAAQFHPGTQEQANWYGNDARARLELWRAAKRGEVTEADLAARKSLALWPFD